jgi:isoleucyl-tRNA synthetase
VTTELDDELLQEGRVYDLTHQLNTMRKEAGLALTDRIRVVLPESDADLLDYEERIKDEVLATEIVVGQVAEPQIERI